jgi:hypothetical protein
MNTLKTIFTPSFQGSEDLLSEPYEISYEPMTSNIEKKLPPQELKKYITLFDNAFTDPATVCEGLEKFRVEHPSIPEVDNLLSYVYIKLRKLRKAEDLIKESYEKYPDYLFAKINYADQCLRKGKFKLVPPIFDHKFTLRALLPEKKVFHYSEFRGFMVVMGFYHLAIRQRNAAESYYHSAMLVDPIHTTVRALEIKLFKLSFLQKVLKRFLSLSSPKTF